MTYLAINLPTGETCSSVPYYITFFFHYPPFETEYGDLKLKRILEVAWFAIFQMNLSGKIIEECKWYL